MSLPSIPPHARFRLKAGVLMRELDGEAVLLDVDRGSYFGLNATGLKIVARCDGTQSLRDIQEALVAEFDVGAEELAADLAELVGALERAGLLLRSE
jgi:hypothetical protein